MAELDINATTTPTKIADEQIDRVSPDMTFNDREGTWNNTDFTKFFGDYKEVAKIKTAINTFATWVLGKGFTTDNGTQVILDGITGWGEDTFQSILWNMIVIKKVNGDAYAQIIRNPETGTLLNIKPLNPELMTHVVNKQNMIIRYEYRVRGKPIKFKPEEILHLVNDRVANEIHGVSAVEAVQWNIEATEEAKKSHRKMVKRNGVIRVIEVDTDDSVKLKNLKAQWKDAIEKGDVLIIPKGVAEAKDWHGTLDTNGVVTWLRYLDDDFYMSIGVPRVILGGETGATEAGAKVSYLVFEPQYTRETTELEADLWNQLAIRITFNKPTSMLDNMAESEAANTGQVGFQPNDVTAGSGEA